MIVEAHDGAREGAGHSDWASMALVGGFASFAFLATYLG
jgi:hypothetical protein